jgi:hypothetical protein
MVEVEGFGGFFDFGVEAGALSAVHVDFRGTPMGRIMS